MVDLGALMHPLVYLIAYIPGVVALCTLTVGGLWTWSVPILIFGCVPLIELFWKGSGKNPSTEEEQHLKSNIVFNTLLYGIVPLHCSVVGMFLFGLSLGWTPNNTAKTLYLLNDLHV